MDGCRVLFPRRIGWPGDAQMTSAFIIGLALGAVIGFIGAVWFLWFYG